MNSEIFLISIREKKFILKKEKINKKEFLIEKKKFDYLKKNNNSLIVFPVQFFFKQNILWSKYEFFKGNTFRGTNNELCNIGKKLCKIQNIFLNIKFTVPKNQYFSKEDIKIVNMYKKNKALVNQIFTHKNKQMNNLSFKLFLEQWTEQSKKFKKVKKLRRINCYNDLHPKNIIFFKRKIRVLDIKSVKKIPLEFALSYSALKLCRQSIIYRKTKKYHDVGFKFIELLKSNFNMKLSNNLTISDYAIIETLRRICFILKANYNNDKSSNLILPILIANIIEAKKIFKNLTF
jgi:hypothetical protein